LGWRAQGSKAAALGAVEDLPAAVTQPLAKSVGSLEVPLAPSLDALGEELLRLLAVRPNPSWL